MIRNNSIADSHALQARLGARLSRALSERAGMLPHDIGERLRIAREHALARARQLREPAAAAVTVGRGPAGLLAATPWWQRLASVLPLLALLTGLVLIDEWTSREQMRAAAEVDALLLADDLPPAAYTDPGFAEFLKAPPP